MKKFTFLVSAAFLIVPSFALASWWNPFTWNIFSHKNTTTITQPITPQTNVRETVKISTSTEKVVVGVKNCMNDLQCIVDAAKTCEPAKADVTTTIDFGKMFAAMAPDPSKVPSLIQTQITRHEIKGLKDGVCVYYNKLIDIKNPKLTSEEVKTLLSQTGEMTCSYSSSDLVTRLKNVQAGNFSGSVDTNDTPAQKAARQCREFGM